MDNYSKLYWLTRIDPIVTFITTIGVLFFVASFINTLIAYVFLDKNYESVDKCKEIDSVRKKCNKRCKWLISIGIFIIMIMQFVPSRNEVIFIMAGGKTLDFVQSDTSLSKIPYQTTKIISDYLEKAINDTKK